MNRLTEILIWALAVSVVFTATFYFKAMEEHRRVAEATAFAPSRITYINGQPTGYECYGLSVAKCMEVVKWTVN